MLGSQGLRGRSERLRYDVWFTACQKPMLTNVGFQGKWLPALQELVAVVGQKFSDAFDGVGCAGEIKISEHPDDYKLWAIDILVKFRDTEKLQLLTGQRQSGGVSSSPSKIKRSILQDIHRNGR